MLVYMYGMRESARDDYNYWQEDYVRDLYLEEMTADMRDEYYNVLCYKCELHEDIIKKYRYDYISVKDIEV